MTLVYVLLAVAVIFIYFFRKDIKEKIDPYSKGVLTADQMKRSKEIQEQFDKDPTVIVDYIQKALGNK